MCNGIQPPLSLYYNRRNGSLNLTKKKPCPLGNFMVIYSKERAEGIMYKGLLKNIIIVFLLGTAVFLVFKYTASVKEKNGLLNTISQLKEQEALLEGEKQRLSQELSKEKELEKKTAQKNRALKAYLRAGSQRLAKLFMDYDKTAKVIEQLDCRISLLKAENIALMEQKEELLEKNEELKTKINSPVELKRTLKDFKKQTGKAKASPVKEFRFERLSRPEARQDTLLSETEEGNRGFLVKNGQFIYPAKVKIEVSPALTQTVQ